MGDIKPLVLDGQRVKKGLTFARKGYRVNPECVILKNSSTGQITYVRETSRWTKSEQVTVDHEEFVKKFSHWCEPLHERLAREAEVAYRREQRDGAHGPALLENLIFDAARTLGSDAEVLRQCLAEALASAREEGYDEGRDAGYSDGLIDAGAEHQCECC